MTYPNADINSRSHLLGEALIDSNESLSQDARPDDGKYNDIEVDDVVTDDEGVEHKVIQIKVVNGKRLYALELQTEEMPVTYKVITGASLRPSPKFQVGNVLVLRHGPNAKPMRAEIVGRGYRGGEFRSWQYSLKYWNPGPRQDDRPVNNWEHVILRMLSYVAQGDSDESESDSGASE